MSDFRLNSFKFKTSKLILVFILISPFLSAQQNEDITGFFEMSIEELMKIKVITASAKEEIAAEAPANIFVITKENIKEKNYRTLSDMFVDLPGVVVTNSGPSKNVYYTIRGHFDNRRLKVMINGMDINPKSGENLIFGVSRFPVELIEKVEFIIGPYASLYGRNSFSGVLNIITKKGEELNGISGKILYSGTYNHYQAEAVIGEKIGEYDLILSVYHNRSDEGRNLVEEYPEIYSLVVREERRANEGLSPINKDVSKEFIMPWESSNVFFRMKHNNGLFLDFDYNYSKMPKVGAGFQPYLYYQNKDTYLQDVLLNTRLGMDYSFNDVLLTTTMSYQNYTFDGRNGYLDNTEKWYLNKNKSFIFDQKFRYNLSDNDELFARVTYEKLKSYLTVAGERKFKAAKPNWGSKDIVDDNYYNISIQYSKYILKNLEILLGIFFEDSDNKEEIFLPRISVNWHMSKYAHLKFLYGGGYLGVDPVSTVDQIISETNSIKGTKGLHPESLRSHEINFTHYVPKNYSLSVSLFYNRIKDISAIVSDDSLPLPFSRIYKNIGIRRVFGVNFNVNKKLSKKIKAFLNYSYTNGYSEINSKREDNLPISAPHHLNIGLNFLAFYDYINIFIRNSYIHKFYTSTLSEKNGYNNCSLSLNSTAKLFDFMEISVQVNNIFDRKGFDPAISPASYRSDIPIARRNWNLSFRYNLKF